MTRKDHKYSVGEYLTIYVGPNEGCCFTVRSVIWREDFWTGVHKTPSGWWYDTGAYGWKPENMVCTEAHARLFP